MDEIVKQAMAKWPNVPASYGWLGLDARGNWWLRDTEAQAYGAFASGIDGAKGRLVDHAKLAEFINRNYLADANGRWYFQNGPQQVFVELEATPWIWRAQWTPSEGGGSLQIHSHTGVVLACSDVLQVLLDDAGRVYLLAAQGVGLVHTQDVPDIAQALEQGALPEADEVSVAEIERRYYFVSCLRALVER